VLIIYGGTFTFLEVCNMNRLGLLLLSYKKYGKQNLFTAKQAYELCIPQHNPALKKR